MTAAYITIAAVYILFGSWIVKLLKGNHSADAQPEQSDEDDDDLDDLLEVIDNLSDMRYRIEQLNDMSIDLKTCEPGRLHKTIKITIIDNRHEYDFMTTGQDLVSESVLKMISAERERVTTALRSENRKIR